MNKETFIRELNKKLSKLPKEEKESALEYYIEYFNEADIKNDENVDKELGSPSKIASEILANYAIKDNVGKTKASKIRISAIWFIILAILAAPITLPLVIALISIILSMVLVMLSLIFAFGITALAIVGTGFFTIFAGFTVMVQDFATSIMFIGIGLATLGVGILISMAIFYLSKLSFRGIISISNKLLKKFGSSKLK
ncbi:DUF1700 domain-containing protein [Clostridium tarantellae]|uniref:DUF1700 domain-containing protein n=1 Tax=Clostridium tarantellae TaxID=39493 RepID=A0A6I1MLL7_9CLOT|nr:DUF1700 domain-containing protein [Clostridium tarantellae]MPQ43910.1 DUF1700 domain-containing protein [Clostridium tarantellae]